VAPAEIHVLAGYALAANAMIASIRMRTMIPMMIEIAIDWNRSGRS
jgi:hypothetical protein